MFEGIQIGGLTAIFGIVVAGLAFVAKGWMTLNRQVAERRANESEQFADLLFEFMDAHRANQLDRLKPANQAIRTAMPRLHIWTSTEVAKKLTEFLSVSNSVVERLLSNEEVSPELERALVTVNGNLLFALQKDALGYSRQGLQVRIDNWRALRSQKKMAEKT